MCDNGAIEWLSAVGIAPHLAFSTTLSSVLSSQLLLKIAEARPVLEMETADK